MRVAVNTERCQGHARCITVLSDVFDSDDLGYGFARDEGLVPAGMEATARQVVGNCPEHAIDIVEE